MAAHLIPHYYFFGFPLSSCVPFPSFWAGRGGREGTDTQKQNNGEGGGYFFVYSPKTRDFFCAWQCDESGGGPCKGRGWRWTHIQVPSSSFNLLFFLCLLLFSWVGEEGSFCIEKTKNPFVASVPMLRRQLCSRYMKS